MNVWPQNTHTSTYGGWYSSTLNTCVCEMCEDQTIHSYFIKIK